MDVDKEKTECLSDEHHFQQAGGPDRMNDKVLLFYCTNCGQTKVVSIDTLLDIK